MAPTPLQFLMVLHNHVFRWDSLALCVSLDPSPQVGNQADIGVSIGAVPVSMCVSMCASVCARATYQMLCIFDPIELTMQRTSETIRGLHLFST